MDSSRIAVLALAAGGLVAALSCPSARAQDKKVSEWRDIGMCGRGARCDMRGDWDLIELIEARPAKQ